MTHQAETTSRAATRVLLCEPGQSSLRTWIAAYQFARLTKWLLWTGSVGFSMYFVCDPTPHVGRLGNLAPMTEMMMFGLPMAAVVMGMLELMRRDKAYPRLILAHKASS